MPHRKTAKAKLQEFEARCKYVHWVADGRRWSKLLDISKRILLQPLYSMPTIVGN